MRDGFRKAGSNQSARTGPQRKPNRRVPAAQRVFDQHDADRVAASQQQQHQHHAAERHHHRTHDRLRAGRRTPERRQQNLRLVESAFGNRLIQPPRHSADHTGGLRARDARFEPREQRKRFGLANFKPWRAALDYVVQRQGQIQAQRQARVRTLKLTRRDTRDPDRLPVQINRSPDDRGIRVETRLPPVVAQYGDRVGHGVRRMEQASGAGFKLQRRKEVAAHKQRPMLLRLPCPA